jgi:hypothetical protein
VTAPQPPAVPELYWSPSAAAVNPGLLSGLFYSTLDGVYVTPSYLPADAVRLVPADDLERLRGIEQRARHMVDNPGRYDEDDVSTARFILGEDTPNA